MAQQCDKYLVPSYKIFLVSQFLVSPLKIVPILIKVIFLLIVKCTLPILHFCTPRKRQKTEGFLTLSGGTKCNIGRIWVKSMTCSPIIKRSLSFAETFYF